MMSDHSELLRTDFAVSVKGILSEEQLTLVLGALSTVMTKYNVEQKSTGLIAQNVVPEAVKYFIASKALENLSESTVRYYTSILKKFFYSVRKQPHEITTNDIRACFYELRINRKISAKTIQTYQRILSSFFGWLMNNDYIQKNPMLKIEKIKVEEKRLSPMSPYELELVRNYCVVPREKAIIDFLYSTGCRVSECCNVQLSDIDWTQYSVFIRHGKGAKDRVVYFNAEAAVSMKKYLATRTDDCPYLFVPGEGKAKHRLSSRSVENVVKKIVDRTGIEKRFTPHTLRRTFATLGIRSGMPLERMQALMGHSKPETTLIYAQLDETDLKSAYRQAFI